MEILIHSVQNPLRNSNYLLKAERGEVYCIDPWDADELAPMIDAWGGQLKAIINTHEHFDHIRGNEELVRRYGCEVWVHQQALKKIPKATRGLLANETIDLGAEESFLVLDTPGHTSSHLCLLLREKQQAIGLLSGDTLFNAGVGNCHNGGDPETLYETIVGQIYPLPDAVVVYPGHDYLLNNLRFTIDREPHNLRAQELLKKLSGTHGEISQTLTTIGLEREINTFFRLGSPEIRRGLKLADDASDKDVFLALRKLRNDW